MVRLFYMLFIIMFSLGIHAQDKPILHVVSESWVGVTNADGTGTYWDIVRASLADKYTIKISVTSWARAVQLVKTGKADILVGTYKEQNKSLLYSEQHIDTEHPIYLLFDPKKMLPNSVDDLTDKLIAGRKDWGFEHHLPESTRFYGVQDIRDISKLVINGRIDGALAYGYNLLLADPNRILSSMVVIPQLPLYLAFTDSDKGRSVKKNFDEEISVLVERGSLAKFFDSDVEFQFANLKSDKAIKMVDWHLMPKVFNQEKKQLDVIPWELNTTKYIDNHLTAIKINIKVNRFSETQRYLNTPNNCVFSVRKPEIQDKRILYSSPIDVFIKPRLFVLTDSAIEHDLRSWKGGDDLSIRELLSYYPEFRILIKENYNINKRLIDEIGDEYTNRVIDINNSDYAILINMLEKQKVDALIVWPSIVASLNNGRNDIKKLSSFAFTENIAKEVFTYIACYNDDMGKSVITDVNKILNNSSYQKDIYQSLINNMDINSAKDYKTKLGLGF